MRFLRRLLLRKAVLDGFFGASRAWTIVGAVLLTRRALKRVFGDRPEVVYRAELPDGQAIVVSATGREPRVLGGR